MSRYLPALLLLLTLAGVMLGAYGLAHEELLAAVYWQETPLKDYARLSAFLILACLVLRRGGFWLAAALFFGLCLATPPGFFAVLLLAAGALAVGSRLAAGSLEGIAAWPVRWALAFILGLACLSAGFSVLAHTPWNTPFIYAGLLLGGVLLAWRGLKLRIDELIVAVNAEATRGWGRRLGLGLLLSVLAISASSAFAPFASADDMAYHLKLAHELYGRGQAGFDYRLNVWAVAPYAADLLHAIPFVISGGVERSMNLLQLLLYVSSIVLLYGLLRGRVGRLASGLLTAMYAATPYVHTMNSVLQTELLTVCVVLAWLQAIELVRSSGRAPAFGLAMAMSVLGGFLLAIKLSNAFLVLGMGLVLIAQYRHDWRTFGRHLPAMALGFAVVGLQSYLYAYHATGNPLFPLFNAVFQSPHFDSAANFTNPVWQGKLSWSALYDVAIRTSLFSEERNGTAGFQWLVLFPVAVVAALGHWRTMGHVVLVVLLFILGVAPAQQYYRYFLPALPLLTLLCAALFLSCQTRWQRGVLSVVVAAVTVANLYFLPLASWFLGPQQLLRAAYSDEAREQYLIYSAPEYFANEYLNRMYGAQVAVLYPRGRIVGGNLYGDAHYLDWYNYGLSRLAYADELRVEQLVELVRQHGITHVVMPAEDFPLQHRAAFEAFLNSHGEPIPVRGRASLFRVRDDVHWAPRTLDNLDFSRAGEGWFVVGDVGFADNRAIVNAVNRVERLFSVRPRERLRLTLSIVCQQGPGKAVVKLNWYREQVANQHEVRQFECGAESRTVEVLGAVPENIQSAGIELTSGDESPVAFSPRALESRAPVLKR